MRHGRLITRADLDGIAEPVAALLLELPQREIGGSLPSWSELQKQIAWARERGVRLHLDGARLWESAPYYSRPCGDIAALFDTVYVSFYKTLGGIAGAVLAGSQEFIAEARVWQRRHGGNLVALYPYVMSAQSAIAARMDRMDGYHKRAVSVARVLAGLPGVRVTPDPPHTNLLHALLPVTGERLLDASAEMAAADRVTLFTSARPCDVPGYCLVEIVLGDAAEAIGDDELAERVAHLLLAAQAPAK